MKDPIIVLPYDPDWAGEFQAIGRRLRQALQEVAIRIDHIGSTSVSGLAAKPVIDIQISVRSFEPLLLFRDPLVELGYVYRADNSDLTKRYFRESPGKRRTHIHVREHGSFAEQSALLFRDYLSAHQAAAGEYADLKSKLGELYKHDRVRYVNEKDPFIWETMRKANQWSQEAGWKPAKSDC
ncbi:GrpB family protein [Paenibacillus tarimensis]